MAVETLPETSPRTAGLVLTGNYLSGKVDLGRDDGKGGRWPDKFVVTLLVGDRTAQVEYRNEDAASAAIIEGSTDSDRHEAPDWTMLPVSLPVGVRAAKGFVFYYGRKV